MPQILSVCCGKLVATHLTLEMLKFGGTEGLQTPHNFHSVNKGKVMGCASECRTHPAGQGGEQMLSGARGKQLL